MVKMAGETAESHRPQLQLIMEMMQTQTRQMQLLMDRGAVAHAPSTPLQAADVREVVNVAAQKVALVVAPVASQAAAAAAAAVAASQP